MNLRRLLSRAWGRVLAFLGRGPLPSAVDAVEAASRSPLASSEGAKVVSLNIWSEGEKKCPEHCWHKLKSSSLHKNCLGLLPSEMHQDYFCCRCAHVLCHIGPPDPSFKTLSKHHRSLKDG